MHTCSLFTSANDIVLELKKIISTTFLLDYRKYNHIKLSNEIQMKTQLNLKPRMGLQCRIDNYRMSGDSVK